MIKFHLKGTELMEFISIIKAVASHIEEGTLTVTKEGNMGIIEIDSTKSKLFKVDIKKNLFYFHYVEEHCICINFPYLYDMIKDAKNKLTILITQEDMFHIKVENENTETKYAMKICKSTPNVYNNKLGTYSTHVHIPVKSLYNVYRKLKEIDDITIPPHISVYSKTEKISKYIVCQDMLVEPNDVTSVSMQYNTKQLVFKRQCDNIRRTITVNYEIDMYSPEPIDVTYTYDMEMLLKLSEHFLFCVNTFIFLKEDYPVIFQFGSPHAKLTIVLTPQMRFEDFIENPSDL